MYSLEEILGLFDLDYDIDTEGIKKPNGKFSCYIQINRDYQRIISYFIKSI